VAADPRAADDLPAVAALCAELVSFDSSIVGGRERACAERVAGELSALGLTPQVFEAEPGRTNVVARLAGSDPTLGALLVHVHLDVVPAEPDLWQVHAYAGEVRDGHVWGRGAVDMKNMAAVVLTALATRTARGWRPRRDVVLAFVADEELGGGLGARFLVERHPELFEGCTEAIGEAGGFSHEYAADRRAYLVQVGEKGISWLRLVARGQGGHGSFAHEDNAPAAVAAAVHRIQTHDFGLRSWTSRSGWPAPRWRRGSPGRYPTRSPRHWPPRTRAAPSSRPASRSAPTPSTSPGWGSPATASRRCSCRPATTSPACSTGSTSGSRCRASPSASG
jgi:acetylornithine deacetylase/succinyl-diaminopimelate desuccinylase-like protein